jgi:pyruvate/2-oxoglutarate dehydrogenase complex dihydrolipoamide acyltransferase (E2) component
MSDDFELVPLPKTRQAIRDMLRVGTQKNMIHGLAEIDVSLPRKLISQYKERTGEKLSFTAFIINCLAKAVDEHKIVHGYRKGKDNVVIFNDVDVNTQIERVVDGEKWVMPYIVRAANKKEFADVHQEIRDAQVKAVKGSREYRWFDLYLKAPSFFRRAFFWVFVRSPGLQKNIAGTVGVTALGMFAEGGFWGIPITTQTLLITLGGISKKPSIINDALGEREYLSVTLSFDHDIIDGAPAARFSQRFKELIEGGYGMLPGDS